MFGHLMITHYLFLLLILISLRFNKSLKLNMVLVCSDIEFFISDLLMQDFSAII